MTASNELAKPALYTLLVNEHSGGGRAGRVLGSVVRQLSDQLPAVELRILRTTSYEDARNQAVAAAAAAQEGDALLAMGGDGMAHVGLNACAYSNAKLGIIPAGTGNDFARGVGAPTSLSQAISAIVAAKVRTVDLSEVITGDGVRRYVGAVVSTGYDAIVNRETNRTKLRFGALSYGVIALRELAAFSPMQYQMRIDGVEHDFEAMLVAVCNTGIFGGGIKIAPDADPEDGKLDITIVEPVPKTTLLRLLPSLYTGKFVKNPAVKRLRAETVYLAGEELFAMGDGEEIGSVPVSIEPAASALRVFVS